MDPVGSINAAAILEQTLVFEFSSNPGSALSERQLHLATQASV